MLRGEIHDRSAQISPLVKAETEVLLIHNGSSFGQPIPKLHMHQHKTTSIDYIMIYIKKCHQ